MATQNVSLNPGESKVVSFQAVPTEARTYQVSVNGLTGSFRAVAAPSLPFTFTNVSVVATSDYPRAGDWIVPLFKATINNPNSVSVSHELRMMVSSFDTYNNLPWWPPTAVYTWVQTLPAGGNYQYETNFWNEVRQAYDILIGRYARWDFWLEDELGNKSEVVSIST